MNQKVYIIICILLAALGIIGIVLGSVYGRILGSSQFYEGATNLLLVSQATTQQKEGQESELVVDCEGLNIVVLYKEAQVKEGKLFMDECGLSVFNCGPSDVDLSTVLVSWYLGGYANGTGTLGSDVLKKNDVKILGCGEVFDPVEINIDTDQFLIEKIPARVELSASPTGTTWDGWEVTYISQRGLF